MKNILRKVIVCRSHFWFDRGRPYEKILSCFPPFAGVAAPVKNKLSSEEVEARVVDELVGDTTHLREMTWLIIFDECGELIY